MLAGAIDFFGCGCREGRGRRRHAGLASPRTAVRRADRRRLRNSAVGVRVATRRRWPSVQVDSDEGDYAPPAGRLYRLKPVARKVAAAPLALKGSRHLGGEELEPSRSAGLSPSAWWATASGGPELRLDTPRAIG